VTTIIEFINKRLGQNYSLKMRKRTVSMKILMQSVFLIYLPLVYCHLCCSWRYTSFFLKFTAMSANPNSFSTFDFPLTENRENDKLTFRNPKTGSMLFIAK